MRRLRHALVAMIVAAIALSSTAAGSAAANCLAPPVDTAITRRFDAPACPWCAGHRGINYSPPVGTAVRAAASGTVTFSGVVVGVRYVVVRHGDGLLATYGGLASSSLSKGDTVATGAVVGRSDGELYFGLRSGPDTYIDPEPRIGRLVVPPYLVPVDGSPGRPPPEPVLECS